MRSKNDLPAPAVIVDDNPIRQHSRAAGDTGAVAAGFADDGGRFAGDGRFVDRGDALNNFAVAGNDLAGFDNYSIAGLQCRGDRFLNAVVSLQPKCRSRLSSFSQCIGLRLARASASAEAKLAKITVRNSQISSAIKYRTPAWLL